MTGREMKEKIALAIRERCVQNIYIIILRGFRDPDMIYDTDRMDSYGNIVEILDETKPVWRQSHWLREYRPCWRQRGANYEDNRTDPEEFR